MQAVKEFADQGGLVLGICNGFQILCEAGLLPGALIRNRSLQFRCEHVYLKVATQDSPFTQAIPEGKLLRIPIAHGEGNYFCDAATLEELRRFDEAEALFRRALAGGEARFGSTHPDMVIAVWNLATFLSSKKRGKYAEAAPLFRRVADGAAAHPDDAHCRRMLSGDVQQGIRDCEDVLAAPPSGGTTKKKAKKIKPNAKCPCGSGKKYKKCCRNKLM